MLLGGWSIEAHALLVEKGASNLYSNFERGIGCHVHFLILWLATRELAYNILMVNVLMVNVE
jgi:hypothetical protein